MIHLRQAQKHFTIWSFLFIASACGSSSETKTSAATTTNTTTSTSDTSSTATAASDANTSDSNTNLVGTVIDGNLVMTPTVEVGPFWVEELLNRSDVLSDPNTGTVQQGVALALDVYLHEVNNLTSYPLEGCTVDLWQANSQGLYSDESQESTSGQKWLRGYQISDAAGKVSFSTIVPGWYSGRTPHIHFRLRKTTNGSTFNWTTQSFVSDALTKAVYTQSPYATHTGQDTFTTNDRLYQAVCTEGSDALKCGDLLLIDTTTSAAGYHGELHIYVDSITNG